MENEVKVLKLITGEELIARVTESDIQITEGDGVDMLILERPRLLYSFALNPAGEMDFGMLDWLKSGKADKITIEVKHIVVIVDPIPEMEKTYLSWLTGLSL